MQRRFRRWLADERGQDLVEYMLLTTLIGIAALIGVNALSDSLTTVYLSWDQAIQDPAVVEVADPL